MLGHRPATVVSTLLLTLSLGSPATSHARTEFELTASDGAADDDFGILVGFSGDPAVVGAFRNDRFGSLYLFRMAVGNLTAYRYRRTAYQYRR